MRIFALLVLLWVPLRAALGASEAAAPQALTVSDAWVRATVEAQTGSGAFLRLTSRQDAQLIGAKSPVADRVEIHEMRLVKDVMTMRRIDSLALPAGKTVALEHGHHIMLIGLKHQLQPGQSVPLTLLWVDAKGVRHATDVLAPVRALNASAGRP